MSSGSGKTVIDRDVAGIPIVVGVCGHRDLADSEESLKQALDSVWACLRQKFPHSNFLVLDSLAEGADRIVLKYLPADIPYVAVLPFSAERYMEDFSDERSREEFRGYLQRAAKTVVAKNEAHDYTGAANYVREHSDLLLALWDMKADLKGGEGGVPHAPGGTGDSVLHTLQNERMIFPDERRIVDVLHIPVRRSGGAPAIPADPKPGQFRIIRPGDEPQNTQMLFPERWVPDNDLLTIDFLNRHCRKDRTIKAQMPESIAGEEESLRRDVIRYNCFDWLAATVHRRQKWAFRIIFMIAVIFAALLLLRHFFPDYDIFKEINIPANGILLVAMGVYFRYLDLFDKPDLHMQSRSIAEVLRIRLFWNLWGGLEPVTSHFPDDNMLYIRIFRNWELADPPPSPGLHRESDVLEHWIGDQRAWLGRCSRGARLKDLLAKWLLWGLTGGILLLAFLALAFSGKVPWLTGLGEVLLGVGVFVFFCLRYLRQKKSWDRLSEGYYRSYLNFDYLYRNFRHFSAEERTKMIQKLGIRALKENSTWRGLRRKVRS